MKGHRFFARLRSFQLACPRCDLVITVITGKGQSSFAVNKERPWNPLTQRFRCSGCGMVAYLGIVAWAAPPRGQVGVAEDQQPTFQEALALRRKENVWVTTAGLRVKTAGRNLVRREEEMGEDEGGVEVTEEEG